MAGTVMKRILSRYRGAVRKEKEFPSVLFLGLSVLLLNSKYLRKIQV